MPKVRSARAKKRVTRELKSLTTSEKAEVLNEVEKEAEAQAQVESGERRPGMTISGEKVPYTYQWFVDNYDIVTFIPEKTVPLTINGVRVQAITGLEMHVPRPFYELYAKTQKSSRDAPKDIEKHFKSMGYESIVIPGAGWEPER